MSSGGRGSGSPGERLAAAHLFADRRRLGAETPSSVTFSNLRSNLTFEFDGKTTSSEELETTTPVGCLAVMATQRTAASGPG